MGIEIPIANWPDGGVGKVVQIYVDDKPYLRFKRPEIGEKVRHGAILRDFLGELKIPYTAIRGADTGDEIPTPTGGSYRVIGMGEFEVDWNNEHLIRFRGSSFDYNLRIDRKHLDDIMRLQPDWVLR